MSQQGLPAMPPSLPTHRMSGPASLKMQAIGCNLRINPNGAGPIVIGLAVDAPGFPRAAVIAVAAVGAVEPDFGDGAIVCEQFGQLIAVISDVGRGSVKGGIAVPRRKVDAEFQSLFAAGAAKFPSPRPRGRRATGCV